MLAGKPHVACQVYIGPDIIGVFLSNVSKNAQFGHQGLQLVIKSMAHSGFGLIPNVDRKLARSLSLGQLGF
ncbi:MAG: hypothetical protein EBU08_13900 [Micrococcales bacterium]|jgi:hypothetical protein|nr:hypothetical protein [Micrococcales bacterium]